MTLLQSGIAKPSSGYDIDQSLRFNDDDSAYLNRTAGTATSNDIGTFSFWTKRGNLGGGNSFFSNHSDANNRTYIGFDADTITMFGKISGSANVELLTTPVFRDPSAWYHIVIAVDVTQASASNRVKIYVNGTQITDFSTSDYPAQNTDLPLFSKTNHQVGAFFSSSIGDYYDGYLAEYYYIDGQQLAPASFGETNSDTNQWQAIEYEGSYGNNGFYFKFQDASALGDDSSGNTNDFTVNNLVATDQVLDSPTNNFATLNPLDSALNNTLREGNLLFFTEHGATTTSIRSTQGMSSGKWYAEFYYKSGHGSGNTLILGIKTVGSKITDTFNTTSVYSYAALDGDKWNGTGATYGASYTIGDIIGIALDLDANTLTFYKNNVTQGTAFSGLIDEYAFWIGSENYQSEVVCNFGQDSSFAGNKTSGAAGSDFYYAPPTGFKALNTDNLSNPSIADPTAHFVTTLVSGNGSNRSITGLNFQPDFLWGKSRTNTLNYYLTDSVRGTGKQLYSDATTAEGSESVIYTAFNSDGFSLGTGDMNLSGQNYAHWGWKGGGTASSNTDGTITSSVSANPTAGFSVLTYTGNNTAGATIGHGLSSAPELIITKGRTASASAHSDDWFVYSKNQGANAALKLNSTATAVTSATQYWNNTSPTSSVFSVSNDTVTNENSRGYVAYCFHSVESYSKVGSYTGNGSTDGTFVYTVFKPQWILVKQTDSIRDWIMYDNKRSEFNVMGDYLHPNLNNAESSSGSVYIDFLSNGFKWRSANTAINVASGNYIYLAFAESPFKYSNAR